jgi:hypothetical protein
MVGKSLTWSENYSGWKATNSNMVGNFPQGVRKGVPSHRTFSLLHPSYRREFPIPFSISVGGFIIRGVEVEGREGVSLNRPIVGGGGGYKRVVNLT